MQLSGYEYEAKRSYRQYEFYSEGPKGRIKKTILYEFMGIKDGINLYNLGFGDYSEGNGINDLSISDNKDRDKVLATVAYTALEFTNYYPNCKIFAKGSTPARTRLYQMGIAKHQSEISEIFDIQGSIDQFLWEPFKIGRNYLAFLAQRKENSFLPLLHLQ